ncbi:MAG: DUF2795 domain-containing protein [Ktedonobacteraceae bacterium]|nr:DUF2795 domain-containing protein [Ktedonobacteraceae bacterium]
MAKINPIQIEKFLKGVDYPASKQELIKHAKKHGADQNACDALEQLPDQTYDGPIGVSKAIGQIDREERKAKS